MLELEHLSKSYQKDGVKAVDDVSLSVKSGEIFGFIGPNGAGKTTTIKMICGMLNPDAGRVTVQGYDMEKDPIQAKKRLGFVPDAPELYDRLTGIEYLNFLGDMYDVSSEERKERIEHYLDMFELKDVMRDPIRTYSRGMRQKLVVTGALLHRPPLWLLDEPMVGLDPRAAHLLKEEMRGHRDAGNTVFFSTHVLEVAEQLCDRIALIHKGRLIALGTLAELKQSEHQDTLENIFLEMTEQGEGEQA